MNSTLIAKDLVKEIKGRLIIDHVSFSISSNEIVGLLGPNGAGKTSTFYSVAGLIQPDQGSVYLDDTKLNGLPLSKRVQMGLGYLPQETSIFTNMTVYENILTYIENNKSYKSKENHHETADHFLKQFDLSLLAQHTAKSLSGGEKRRLEIARLMTLKPKFILLDEPFAGVDPKSINSIKNLIINLSKRYNLGILIIDHNVHETLNMCDRAYIMHQGKMIAEGNSKDIVNNKDARNVYFGEHWN
ncbi:MAG TPA: LPS export ABC transporter ATP-binding protein [Gammaproteobacteria bacterium]|nr:LPS export ABC transporter ATP-binding protein [Gammaproteobacteria bacterium]